LGVAVALVALEVLFRILPVSTSTETSYYNDPMILTYPPHHRFVTATGWSLQNARRHRANNMGFMAEREFVRDPEAIAVIGDSFVEASMLDPAERFPAQLERELAGPPVYAMGSPGTALLDYAERMRFAHEKFGITRFVVVLSRGDIGEVVCGSGNIDAACLDGRTFESRTERHAAPGAVKRILRNFALPQYIFSQLKLNPAAVLAAVQRPKAAGVRRGFDDPEPALTKAALQRFFAVTEPFARGTLFLLLPDWKPETRSAFIEAAARHGARVIDAQGPLAAETARTGLSMQVSPTDAHLNQAAFRVLAGITAQNLTNPARP
jgi:hypothetical protein